MSSARTKKKINKYMKTLAICFLVLLAFFCVANLIKKDNDLSTTEKRTLATFPNLTLTGVLDGSFSSDFEDYASDQILGRDFFINVRSGFSLVLGKRESQGVYYCKKGYLMERMDTVDEEQLNESLSAICSFSDDAGIPSVLVLVPNAVSIYEDLLPSFAITEDQEEWMAYISDAVYDSVTFLDLSETLTELADSGEQVYYYNDHHWTSAAAYAAYPVVAGKLGIDGDNSFTPLMVCDTFTGSLTSESGYSARRYDKIYVYAPDEEISYIVTDNASHTKSASIYDSESLSGTDPYEVFLGGNSSHVNIQTTNTDGGRLLVFKDSYFNCFLPFILSEYSEIDIIDCRYYYDDIDSLLMEKDYDSILYFFNLNTFAEDTSLALVLGGDE